MTNAGHQSDFVLVSDYSTHINEKMKVVFCMLATLVAMVAAGGKAKGHKHGYDRSPYDPNDQLGLVPR